MSLSIGVGDGVSIFYLIVWLLYRRLLLETLPIALLEYTSV